MRTSRQREPESLRRPLVQPCHFLAKLDRSARRQPIRRQFPGHDLQLVHTVDLLGMGIGGQRVTAGLQHRGDAGVAAAVVVVVADRHALPFEPQLGIEIVGQHVDGINPRLGRRSDATRKSEAPHLTTAFTKMLAVTLAGGRLSRCPSPQGIILSGYCAPSGRSWHGQMQAVAQDPRSRSARPRITQCKRMGLQERLGKGARFVNAPPRPARVSRRSRSPSMASQAACNRSLERALVHDAPANSRELATGSGSGSIAHEAPLRRRPVAVNDSPGPFNAARYQCGRTLLRQDLPLG